MTYSDQMKIIKDHQSSYPIKIMPIAKDLGINVFSVPNWEDSISGMIKKNEDKSYSIYVNGKHSKQRRRFTIAHEIAHFILHKTLIGDGIVDDALYRSGLSSDVEVQANKLAADILMPWDLLNPLINKGNTDIDELARMFDVSSSAMSIRIGVPASDSGSSEKQQLSLI